MTIAEPKKSPHIAIVGGGLAGLAAAVALAGSGARITLYEARRSLGGRATSHRDRATGELIDNCQHVSMGCCTNLADFCKRTGLTDAMIRQRVIHFIADGQRYDFQAARWLPAPLHLAPSLMKLRFLSPRDRLQIAKAMGALMRAPRPCDLRKTIGEWLVEQQQSQQAIERFWSVVLVSALSETIDRASFTSARKVFVDGFMATRSGYELEIPRVPLGELYGERLMTWLQQKGVVVELGCSVRSLVMDSQRVRRLSFADKEEVDCDFVILALPWRRVWGLFSDASLAELPAVTQAAAIESAPITGVHLWFDRPITALRHAVLIGKLSQWMFARGTTSQRDASELHYYQVVISASRELAGRDRQSVVDEVVADLKDAFREAADAQLVRWRMVTEQHAVFSVLPDVEAKRPPQRTSISNLMLAGDWTQTGWPATMEGAVRSGYLAAEAVLEEMGQKQAIVAGDLKRGILARWLLRP